MSTYDLHVIRFEKRARQGVIRSEFGSREEDKAKELFKNYQEKNYHFVEHSVATIEHGGGELSRKVLRTFTN